MRQIHERRGRRAADASNRIRPIAACKYYFTAGVEMLKGQPVNRIVCPKTNERYVGTARDLSELCHRLQCGRRTGKCGHAFEAPRSRDGLYAIFQCRAVRNLVQHKLNVGVDPIRERGGVRHHIGGHRRGEITVEKIPPCGVA